MKIAVLVAMDKELSLLLSVMPDANQMKIGSAVYHVGRIGSHEVIVGKCGIGKVNAAVNTFRLIDSSHPDLVINTGVAGGASGRLNIGDVLVADRVAYHDVWCGPGTEYGAADGFEKYFRPSSEGLAISDTLDEKVNHGLICSGDKFIHTAEEVKEIRDKFPEVLAVDMESASIAQTCEMEGVPFLIVRVLSDTPGEGDNVTQYNDFWKIAPQRTFECVKQLIEKL